MSETLKRRLLIAGGTVSVSIGIFGIFVPVLPTTPFLLLAAACYLRSSQRFYDWLMNSRLLGNYIKNYVQGLGLPVKAKLFLIALLWITISISIWVVDSTLVDALLVLVAVGVSLHITFIRTKTG